MINLLFPGSIAGAFTTPLDVVKTRIMLTVGGGDVAKTTKVRVGPIIAQIYKENGAMG